MLNNLKTCLFLFNKMTKLEDYLDKINNKEVNDSIFNKYKDFDYDDEDIFHIDLEFLLNNIF